LPASCRQTHRSKALPARCRQHLGGAVSSVSGSWSQCLRKSERGLSMNRTPSSHPSPPMGEKVPEGRLRGNRLGSWSQCTAQKSWGLSMNLLFGVPALAGPGRLKAGHHTDGTTQTGSWSQCTAQKSWGLSMNLPFVLAVLIVLVLDCVVCLRGRGRVGRFIVETNETSLSVIPGQRTKKR